MFGAGDVGVEEVGVGGVEVADDLFGGVEVEFNCVDFGVGGVFELGKGNLTQS